MRTDILKFVAVRIAIAAAILAGLEFAFRQGAWEWMAKRESNAGQTIAMKRALQTLGPEKLDFVTFGDSRTVYGLDHERIAAVAKARGLTHASVAIPGMHWMSMETLVRWLREQAPQMKGAVIATTISDFKFLGNGTYELNMAAPFLRSWDAEWMSRHVPLDHVNLSTYGSQSALFLYREDIQDLMRYPARRIRDAGALLAKAPAGSTLFSRQKVATDICQVPLTSVAECAATPPAQPFASTVMQCRQWQRETRMDFRETSKLPHLTEVANVREKQFRELPYAKPVLVLLMPMPEIWRREAMPLGAEAWARALLKSLQDKGLIEVHDFTDLFSGGNGPECAAFWDLYHQNTVGQDKLTDAVLPILEQRLYAGIATPQPPSTSK
jgi:hypothetical protein